MTTGEKQQHRLLQRTSAADPANLENGSDGAAIDNKLYRNFMNSGQKRQHSFIRREAVDIQFLNICYDVTCWSLMKKPEQKRILDGCSGKFNSGELNAVMGPSGAGKSSFLNVLAGYIRRGVSGQVFINDRERNNQNMRSLSKLSCYLQQEDALRPTLTTLEIMNITINLKLGSKVSAEQKQQQIEELLETLGLSQTKNTMCSRLSGGQKKRLAIALELISNPPVIFLDEPTSGLDSSSTSQCVSMLKFLAHQGRTIVCTIHQPSALLFEMFDQLYTLADGKCIYQGSIKGLLPHLNGLGLICPKFHNPADFLLDVAIGEYNADVLELQEAAKKQLAQRGGIFSEKASFFKSVNGECQEMVTKGKDASNLDKVVENIPGPASLWMQFYLLLFRNLVDIKRNPYLFLIRLAAHAFIGVVFGYLYYDVGSHAHTVLANTVYVYGTNLFIVYTGKMSVTMSMPQEINMLDREYFNRWYSLAPYYFAKILIEIPFQLLSAYLYLTISYYLTGQPYYWKTLIFVYTFCGLNTLCAQSFGLFIGTTLPVTVAVFVGPVVAVILSMFGFNIFYRDTSPYFRWLFNVSYFRASYHGMMTSLYNNERGPLDCPEHMAYCHFRKPSKFLENMDIMNVDIYGNIGYIVSLGVVMYIATYIAIWIRLHRR